jgi:general secretion pathway protein L
VRETLFIRLRHRETESAPESRTGAALWSATGGYRDISAPLAELAAQTTNCRVIVFVPAADVRLATVDIPARSPQKVLQAAPYALEEQIAEDVETLHFAIGSRLPAGGYPIAVVARARMSAWLDQLVEHGIHADALVPEQLALPWTSDDRVHLIEDKGTLIARTAAFQSFSCVADDLPIYLQIADPDNRYALRVFVTPASSPDFTQLGRPVELLPGHRSALEVLVKHWREQDSINLLQGVYSQRQQMDRVWGPWRLAAGLAAAWLVLALLVQGLQAYKFHRATVEQDAHNVQRYQTLFPDEQRIVDLATQAEQKLATLRSGGATNGVMRLLEPVAAAMTAVPGLAIQNLQFRDGAIYLSLTGRDLQTLEHLRAWFGEHPGTALEVQSANSGSDGVQIRLKLSPA